MVGRDLRAWALVGLTSGCTPVASVVEVMPAEVRAIISEEQLMLVRGTEDSVEVICTVGAPGPERCVDSEPDSESFLLLEPDVACVHPKNVVTLMSYAFVRTPTTAKDCDKAIDMPSSCRLRCPNESVLGVLWTAVRTSTSR